MKMAMQFDFEMAPASLRSACDISLACRPTTAVAHFALDFGAGNESRHGVDDDDVDGAGAHERFRDFKRLLAGVRLRNEKGIHVNAERGGIDRVEGMLHVDERGVAAVFLPLARRSAAQASFCRNFPAHRSR